MTSSSPINLAVLLSGSGTTLQNLVDQIAGGKLNVRIKTVIGSRHDLAGIERAKRAGLETVVVNRKDFPACDPFSWQVFDHVDRAGVDLVCCAGWLCLLDIPERYEGKIINIHPSLLPSFGGQGMYGAKVHAAVIEHGCKVSGCTVHFVDNTYDTGPIILQRTCPVLDTDAPEDLAHRVFEEEKIAFPEAIRLFHAGRLKVDGRRVRITSARDLSEPT